MKFRMVQWLKLTYQLWRHPETRTREQWIEHLQLAPAEIPEFNAYWADRHGH